MVDYHKAHVVLGKYCWTCQRATKAGIPGWGRKNRSDSFIPHGAWDSNASGGYCEGIVWGDGTEHKSNPVCVVCEKHCKHPVEKYFIGNDEPYREMNKSNVN